MSRRVDSNNPSDDTLRIEKCAEPMITVVQQNNVVIMDFSKLLKDHSSIKKAPKGIQGQIVKKKDFYNLVHYLIINSNCNLPIKKREFNRSSYEIKNTIFTYFALEYPNLMKLVSDNKFEYFPFSSQLYQLEDLTSKWNKYVDEVQKMKNKNNLDVQVPDPIIDKEDMLGNSMNLDLDFIDFSNDELEDSSICSDHIDMYDPFESYSESI